MKKQFLRYFKHAFLVLVMLITVNLSQAQIDSTGNPDDNDVAVPFDGGISVLLAAGVAVGIKKVRDERKKQKAPLENQ